MFRHQQGRSENLVDGQYYIIDSRECKESTVDTSILNKMEEEPLFYLSASIPSCDTTVDAEGPLSLRDGSRPLSHSCGESWNQKH